MTAWHLHEPTPEQIEQTQRVETALCNELNLMAREGIPDACLLTGLGTVIADFLTTRTGMESVAPWFTAQGEMIADLTKPRH